MKKHESELNDSIKKMIEIFQLEMNLESVDIEFEEINYDIAKLLKNNIDVSVKVTNKTKNIDLILALLEIIESNNREKPTRQLLIFNNIDNYISPKDYRSLISISDAIGKNNDIYFIFVTSKRGYTIVNEKYVENISIVNDIVFNMVSLEFMKAFIHSNYPIDKEIEEVDFIMLLEEIIQYIGMENSMGQIQSQIMLKIINKSEKMKINKVEDVNEIELRYLYLE